MYDDTQCDTAPGRSSIYKKFTNGKFRRCNDTGAMIWPMQDAWEITERDFSEPKVTIISDQAYTFRVLKGEA